MSKKGRISHERVEALEKRVTVLEERLLKLVNMLDEKVAPIIEHRAKTEQPMGYVPQFDRWPGNER